MTTKERIIIICIALMLAVSIVSACTINDPQVVLPGWSDNTLEFERTHTLLVFWSDGKLYSFWNTAPGWYTIPTPIDNVMWCN